MKQYIEESLAYTEHTKLIDDLVLERKASAEFEEHLDAWDPPKKLTAVLGFFAATLAYSGLTKCGDQTEQIVEGRQFNYLTGPAWVTGALLLLLAVSISALTVLAKAGTKKAAPLTDIKRAPKTAVIEAWDHSQLFADEIRSSFRFVRADLEAAQPSEIRRTDLLRNDLSAPGREAVQVRVDFDPGAVFPKHSHPGEEIVYLIEGLLEYSIEGKPPVTLKAGDVLFIQAGAVHSVKNVGSAKGSELATYIVEKGKPLLVPVK
jgi:quercetin dioxygenase-like cupin family protein